MSIQTLENIPAAVPFRAVDRDWPHSADQPAPLPPAPAPVPTPDHTPAISIPAVVANANKIFKQFSNALEFSIDQQSGRTITQLIDKETETVIRQYPSEEMLSFGRTLDQLTKSDSMAGLLLNKKV